VQVIPVMDLLGGAVVRGVGGQRHLYRPIESRLVQDAQPGSVARALAAAGFRTIYVADLDAIGGGSPAWEIYDQILQAGLAPWVDAGPATVDAALALANFRGDHRQELTALVAGLESLASPTALQAICQAVDPRRLVFSLDLKAGQPLTSQPAWQGLAPVEILRRALQVGVRRFIVLDLASVGMDQGVSTETLCRQLRDLEPRVEITSGGGVRCADDLRLLARAGCDGALVASALHDGRLSVADCLAQW